jgi:hypothetical protein
MIEKTITPVVIISWDKNDNELNRLNEFTLEVISMLDIYY